MSLTYSIAPSTVRYAFEKRNRSQYLLHRGYISITLIDATHGTVLPACLTRATHPSHADPALPYLKPGLWGGGEGISFVGTISYGPQSWRF